MNLKVKSIISIVLTLVIIFASLNISNFESNAMYGSSFRVDTTKERVEIGFRPYEGLKVSDVMSSYVTFNTNFRFEASLYDGKTKMDINDIVEGGKTYKYEATLRSIKVYGREYHPKIKGYSVILSNNSEPAADEFYNDLSVQYVDDYKMIISCYITIKTNTDFDMGYYCIDISENAFDPQANSLDYLPFHEFFNYISGFDKLINSKGMYAYDINLDGLGDIYISRSWCVSTCKKNNL